MGNARSAKRQLKKRNVWIAQEVETQRIQLARKAVEERCKKDAEFAADVLKAVGDDLPQEIRSVAEASVAAGKQAALVEKWEKTGLLDGTKTDANIDQAILIESQQRQLIPEATKPIVGGDLTHEMVPVQTDGGGTILVHPTELPDYPRDGK